jgi:hypothetical protein
MKVECKRFDVSSVDILFGFFELVQPMFAIEI